MKYQEFYINKLTGTYSETLEVFGLAHLLDEVMQKLNTTNRKVEIFNKGSYYQIITSNAFTSESISAIPYFQIIKFLKNKIDTTIPENIGNNYFDYPLQKSLFDEIKNERNKLNSNKKLNAQDKRIKNKELTAYYESEFGKKLDEAFDVYKNMILNPYTGYIKIYSNFHNNQGLFHILIKEILDYYSTRTNASIKGKRQYEFEVDVTAQQLYSPNQGKGLNKIKANNANMTNLDGYWVQETMKISGALNMMICQFVKVGTNYDLKIFVPEFNNILWAKCKELMLEFKRHLKSDSALKLDILNVLNFSINFIHRCENHTGRIKNSLNGFHSVYQKDLGQNKAVTNITYLELPDFIEIDSKIQGGEWIEILKSQKSIIKAIKEQGDAMIGLLNYRNFFCGGDLQSFFKFCNWYSAYLMQSLDKERYYVKPFKIEILNLFYKYMDNSTLKISEIITNDGFQAVASAIRKSTVSLQYTPKDKRMFAIRYGLAQEIQNKSKSQLDLATFMGELIGTYNAETAKVAEKNNGKAYRSNVKDEEILLFYALLDKYPSRLIGALLTSYGFALKAKEVKDESEEIDNEENLI